MSHLRLVLGSGSLARYSQAGGHWNVLLQYLLGLTALGHDATLLELVWSTGDSQRDHQMIYGFFDRLQCHGLGENAVVLLFDKDCEEYDLRFATTYGRSYSETKALINTADMFWNICAAAQQPLLDEFRYPVLIDLDPGHLQVSVPQQNDIRIDKHQRYLTVGLNINEPDCEVPKLGHEWHTFRPFVHIPSWPQPHRPHLASPFSSVTHWNWGELWLDDRILSISKRDAYLRYLQLPQRASGSFELAIQIHPDDRSGDRELLETHGWQLTDPWKVAASPEAYQSYLQHSRAEICCAKPIYQELRTGWFSDRSVAYLASGRPVLAEDTGYSAHLPTGMGIVAFNDLDGAVAGVADINDNYSQHTRAARELAESLFDARGCLEQMLTACF